MTEEEARLVFLTMFDKLTNYFKKIDQAIAFINLERGKVFDMLEEMQQNPEIKMYVDLARKEHN